MKRIIFSTGNVQKFAMGQAVCQEYSLKLIKQDLDIDEVQSENPEYVARRKAEAVFSLVKDSVVISDDAWCIFGLNGFPGTYAKSVNTWFSADDYIRLTKDLIDRRIVIMQSLVYQNEHTQKLFTNKTTGTLLPEPRGKAGDTIQKVVSLEPDGQTSISEKIGSDSHYSGESTLQVWHDFAKWFKKVQS